MRITKWTTISLIALALSCLGASPLLAGENHGAKMRWDIWAPEVDTTTGVTTIVAGGHSVSQATFSAIQAAGDDSTITLTGSGTFTLNEGHDVTGGGTWVTAMKDGTVTGSGTYRVTELVRFDSAPGSLAGVPGFVDAIANVAYSRAGLAVMKIAYSDGAKGILVFSCSIFSPPAIFEGTTATKGFVDYYNALFPDFTFGNTIFHIIPED
jgi:hypothetical protein